MSNLKKCSICKTKGHTKLKCKYKEKNQVFVNKECPICYNEINQNNGFLLTNCKHSFCFNCFMKWNVENNTCPLCRKKVSEKKPIQIIPLLEIEIPIEVEVPIEVEIEVPVEIEVIRTQTRIIYMCVGSLLTFFYFYINIYLKSIVIVIFTIYIIKN